MKRIISAVLCAVMILSLAACTSFKSSKEESAVVMNCGGYSVTYETWRYFTLKALDERKENAGLEITDEFIASDEGKALNESILAEADESIKSLYAVFALAKEYGIDIENEAIIESANAAVESQEASYESKRAYKKALEDEHMTKTVAHTVAVFDTVYSEIYEAMLNSGEIVTDREKLREIYFSDEFIRIKELMFSVQKHSAEECRALADEAEEALRAGADFDSYVNKNGESLFMFKNSDGHYITRGIWDIALEDAAFSLGIGEISGVIEGGDGCRILMRAEKESSYIDENESTLFDTYREGVFRRKIEDAVAGITLEKEPLCSEYTVYTMK